jgi:hypothetical protein
MREHDFRAFPHFALHNYSISSPALHPTIGALADTINVPNQNDRFSYIHNFRLILVRFCAGRGIYARPIRIFAIHGVMMMPGNCAQRRQGCQRGGGSVAP